MANDKSTGHNDSGSSMESLDLDISRLAPLLSHHEHESAHLRASTIEAIPMERIDSSDDEAMDDGSSRRNQSAAPRPKKSSTYKEMRARMRGSPLTLSEVSQAPELLTSPLSGEEDNGTGKMNAFGRRRVASNGLRRSRCLRLNFDQLLSYQDCVINPAGAGFCTARKKAESLTKELSKLRDYLYIGDVKAAGNVRVLKAKGITHIVNLAGAVCENAGEGQFAYLTLTPKDCEKEDLSCLFLPIAAFIDSARSVGGKVLIHCYRGISRSCTAALAYIMLDEGKSLCEAWRELTQVRPVASPNRGFMAALAVLEKWQKCGTECPRVWKVKVEPGHLALMKRVGGVPDTNTSKNEILVLEHGHRSGIQVFRGNDVSEACWGVAVPAIDRFMEQIEKNHSFYPCEATAGNQRVAEWVDEPQMMQWQGVLECC